MYLEHQQNLNGDHSWVSSSRCNLPSATINFSVYRSAVKILVNSWSNFTDLWYLSEFIGMHRNNSNTKNKPNIGVFVDLKSNFILPALYSSRNRRQSSKHRDSRTEFEINSESGISLFTADNILLAVVVTGRRTILKLILLNNIIFTCHLKGFT